jgi:hypothetical protein
MGGDCLEVQTHLLRRRITTRGKSRRVLLFLTTCEFYCECNPTLRARPELTEALLPNQALSESKVEKQRGAGCLL